MRATHTSKSGSRKRMHSDHTANHHLPNLLCILAHILWACVVVMLRNPMSLCYFLAVRRCSVGQKVLTLAKKIRAHTSIGRWREQNENDIRLNEEQLNDWTECAIIFLDYFLLYGSSETSSFPAFFGEINDFIQWILHQSCHWANHISVEEYIFPSEKHVHTCDGNNGSSLTAITEKHQSYHPFASRTMGIWKIVFCFRQTIEIFYAVLLQ